MPKLWESIWGKRGKVKQKSTLLPEQQEIIRLINEGLTSGKGPLADIFKGFDAAAFEKGVTQPALKNFQENVLPMLQEKFIAGNQVLGSGRMRAEGKAASDLQSQLAQLMYGAQQDALKNKMTGISLSLGTKGLENVYKPASTGFIPGVAQSAAEGFGKAAGASIAG